MSRHVLCGSTRILQKGICQRTVNLIGHSLGREEDGLARQIVVEFVDSPFTDTPEVARLPGQPR